MLHPTRAIGASCLLALCAVPAAAQQELYVLARFNRILRIDGYDTGAPNPVVAANWAWSSAPQTPSGLVVEAGTGDFLVVLSGLIEPTASRSQLVRVDSGSGTTSLVCDLPFRNVDGLDQRADGALLAIADNSLLLRIDPANCTFETTPLSQSIPTGNPSWLGAAIDGRGVLDVVDIAARWWSVDPVLGTVAPVGPTISGVLGIERDLDDRLYLTTLSGALHVFDPVTGQTTQLLPDWDVINNGYALAFSLAADGTGIASVCAGLSNSTGAASSLEFLGTSVASANDLELYTRRLPLNSFGYYLMGPNAGSQPVGHGILCIGPPQFRYSLFVQSSGAIGTVRFPVDLANLPNGSTAMAGDTYVFQYWHRDVGSTSNLSDASAVTFR